MNSPFTNPKRTSTTFASVLAGLLIVLLAAIAPVAQQLQKGVSVQLAPTTHAQPMPAADLSNAWIVAVTADGNFFFGTESVTRDNLAEEMIRKPRNRDQNLYIKADARAPYGDLKYVLKAARAASFPSPVLLTAQPKSPEPAAVEPPNGLPVEIGSGSLSGSRQTILEILKSNQEMPLLRVNGKEVAWQNLSNRLEQIFLNQTERQVSVRADSSLPFEQVVRAIDGCEATGANVLLAAPETL
jgi:biopolymer transport protein ExbD